MKTITIKFGSGHAVAVGIFLHSLELKILISWTEEGFMGETTIYAVLKLNSDNAAITPELQLEKIREKPFIKTV